MRFSTGQSSQYDRVRFSLGANYGIIGASKNLEVTNELKKSAQEYVQTKERMYPGGKLQPDKRRINLWPLIFVLAVTAMGLIIVWLMRLPGPNRNMLAIGKAAKAEAVDIAIQSPLELDFKSKQNVLQLRQEAVERHAELLAGNYTPSEAVFGQIVDGLPWWGIEGQLYYGRGDKSIEGASEEARFILNPYLLVAVEFYDWWQGVIPETKLSTFPLYCVPSNLRWQPREAYAEVTYAANCVAMRQDEPFDLIAYNARDLNLNYIYVSYSDSLNISKEDKPQAPYANPQFLHRGGSCGYPGGCNNMSPATPEIDGLQVTALPAKVVIWFWKQQPVSLEQEPNMRFVIHFR
jgi:hypothetical protein